MTVSMRSRYARAWFMSISWGGRNSFTLMLGGAFRHNPSGGLPERVCADGVGHDQEWFSGMPVAGAVGVQQHGEEQEAQTEADRYQSRTQPSHRQGRNRRHDRQHEGQSGWNVVGTYQPRQRVCLVSGYFGLRRPIWSDHEDWRIDPQLFLFAVQVIYRLTCKSTGPEATPPEPGTVHEQRWVTHYDVKSSRSNQIGGIQAREVPLHAEISLPIGGTVIAFILKSDRD